jgi:hypothetical protein
MKNLVLAILLVGAANAEEVKPEQKILGHWQNEAQSDFYYAPGLKLMGSGAKLKVVVVKQDARARTIDLTETDKQGRVHEQHIVFAPDWKSFEGTTAMFGASMTYKMVRIDDKQAP